MVHKQQGLLLPKLATRISISFIFTNTFLGLSHTILTTFFTFGGCEISLIPPTVEERRCIARMVTSGWRARHFRYNCQFLNEIRPEDGMAFYTWMEGRFSGDTTVDVVTTCPACGDHMSYSPSQTSLR